MEVRALAAPTENHTTSDDEETTTHRRVDKTNVRRRKVVKIFAIVVALLLLTLAIILIFKVKDPVIKLNGVMVNQLNLSSPLSNMSLTARVSVKNPNFATFKYRNTSTTIYYRGTVVIGEARGPGGRARARRTTTMNITVDLMIARILGDPNLQSDVSSGLIPISSYTRVGGRVKVLAFITRHANVELNCSVLVNITSQAIHEQQCNREVHL